MKILVVGAKGQVARSFVEVAELLAIEVVAMGRPELGLINSDSIEHAIEKYPQTLLSMPPLIRQLTRLRKKVMWRLVSIAMGRGCWQLSVASMKF